MKDFIAVTMIVAYDKRRAIGKNGRIPWRLPLDRARFKALCHGKKVIMGRKSFEEIGHFVPYCTLVIVSEKMDSAPAGCQLCKSLEEALALCAGYPGNGEVVVAGGERLYRQALPLAKKIYVTELDADFGGDAFFPELPPGKFLRTEEGCFTDGGLLCSTAVLVPAGGQP